MQISRRGALKGASAVATCIAVPAATVPALASEDSVVALYEQWQAIRSKIHQISDGHEAAYQRLPTWAQAGEDQYGRNSGWPDVRDLPEFIEPCQSSNNRAMLGSRPNLSEVRRFNRLEIARVTTMPEATPEYIAILKAAHRTRLRAWGARLREAHELKHQLGVDNIDERLEPYYQRRSEVELKITDTPARSLAGVASKLRLMSNQSSSDPDQLTLSAIADLERMSGEAGP